jgi:hypothetical protein
MEVVRITKKTDKSSKKLKKTNTLYPPGTELSEISNINSGNYTPPRYRVVVLTDVIKTINTLYVVGTELSEEAILHEILGYFLQKYSSKIIYALNELEFSSFHEIRSILNLKNMTMVRKLVFRLEELNIVYELGTKSEEAKIARSFWLNHYPNTRRERQVILFKIRSEFRDAVMTFRESIIKSYISAREYSTIQRRKRLYSDHLAVVTNQLKSLKKIESESIGKCVVCSKIIRKDAVRGKEYHSYNAGLVCRKCNNRATNEQILKWTSKSN